MSAVPYCYTQVSGMTWLLCTVTLHKQTWYCAAKRAQAPEARSMLENVQKCDRT